MKGASKSRKIDFPDSPSRKIYAFLESLGNQLSQMIDCMNSGYF
jgi:hypothetical protein